MPINVVHYVDRKQLTISKEVKLKLLIQDFEV